jgi:AMP-binding enzyme
MANVKIDPAHIVRSEWQDVPIADTDLYTFVFEREMVGGFPPPCKDSQIAFIDAPSGKKITFGELGARVKLLSRGFSKGMGIRNGETICFYMPNNVTSFAPRLTQIDYPTALWAAFRMGAVPSCANPIYTAHELVHQLRLSKSQYILTHPACIKPALEAAAEVGIPESRVFLIVKDSNLKLVNVPDLVILGLTAPEIVRVRLAPGESKRKVALLNFSSGTSGLPKGVLISHYNVISNVCQMYQLESGVKTVGTACNGCLPFFHSIPSHYFSDCSLRSRGAHARAIMPWSYHRNPTRLFSRLLRQRHPQVQNHHSLRRPTDPSRSITPCPTQKPTIQPSSHINLLRRRPLTKGPRPCTPENLAYNLDPPRLGHD